MENKIKTCKHNVKLAFNNDEIVSYCMKCGKILDAYFIEYRFPLLSCGDEPSISSICGVVPPREDTRGNKNESIRNKV